MRVRQVKCGQNFNHANEKKIAQLRAKNDVTHALQMKLHERMNKKQMGSGCDVMWSQQKLRRRNKKTKRRPILTPAIAVRLIKRNRENKKEKRRKRKRKAKKKKAKRKRKRKETKGSKKEESEKRKLKKKQRNTERKKASDTKEKKKGRRKITVTKQKKEKRQKRTKKERAKFFLESKTKPEQILRSLPFALIKLTTKILVN